MADLTKLSYLRAVAEQHRVDILQTGLALVSHSSIWRKRNVEWETERGAQLVLEKAETG
jgi:hypothetical protein